MQDHTRSLAKGLVEAGHDVEVVTTRHPGGLHIEEREGALWHYVDAATHHPWLPRRDPAWLPRSWETFEHLHGKRPFDVIHSESSSAIGLVRRGIHRRVPLAAKFHGNAIAFAKAGLQRARSGDIHAKVREAKGLVWLLGEASQYGHWHRFRPCVWFVPSRSEFENTRRVCFLQRHLGYVVPNGIDANLFRPRSRAGLRSELSLGEGPVFVAAGRLNIEKGMHNAIGALAHLDGTASTARLVIIGDGEERGSLEQLALSLGVGERVLFTGTQSQDILAMYMATADAFLFPTERAEAAPLILPQAMATGVPVVASDIGGITEVVQRSGEYGLLVPPGDVGALGGAMETLLRDKGLRRRLGEAARRRVLAEYTVESMVERTLEVYRAAIARFRRREP